MSPEIKAAHAALMEFYPLELDDLPGEVWQPIKQVPDNIRNEIRHLYKRGVKGCGSRALAKRFGVCQRTVFNIVEEVMP